MCVLVVEDEELAREVICDSLEFEGFKAFPAHDGGQAIEVLEASEQRGERPALILLDLMMPGMNGWTFREWQRRDARFQTIPVIVLSAITDVAGEAKKLDAASFIEKPLRFDALLREVRRFCKRSA